MRSWFDAEPGRELGVRVSRALVGECGEGLAAGARSPMGADRAAVPPQLPSEEAKGRAGDVDYRRVNKHVKPVAATVLLVENPSVGGFTTLSP
ncbi:hypothetical protein GCM10027162_58000 [Streptomyces incanus]